MSLSVTFHKDGVRLPGRGGCFLPSLWLSLEEQAAASITYYLRFIEPPQAAFPLTTRS